IIDVFLVANAVGKIAPGLGGLFVKEAEVGAKIDIEVINGIKALPAGAKLTPIQIVELNKNIDALLNNSLPNLVKSGKVENLVNVFKNDPRFRFLDQVPGAQERINQALQKVGSSLKK